MGKCPNCLDYCIQEQCQWWSWNSSPKACELREIAQKVKGFIPEKNKEDSMMLRKDVK